MATFLPPEQDPVWQKMIQSGEIAGHSVILHQETISTNTDALKLGQNGSPSGTVIIALSQTGGRGRLGKTWISPAETGLYFSMIIRPALAPADLAKITLAAGVALCQAISPHSRIAPMIKWPNDLLLDGKKCGGILTETQWQSGNNPLVVVGIGLNMLTPQHAFPEKLRDKATSLQQHCFGPLKKGILLESIITNLDRVIKDMEQGEFAEILQRWRSLDATRGKRLTWLTTGHQVVTGISLGPDDEGLLHIRDDQGKIHEVLSGDIRLQSV